MQIDIQNLIQVTGSTTGNDTGAGKGAKTEADGDFMMALLGVLQQGDGKGKLQMLAGNAGQKLPEDMFLGMVTPKVLQQEKSESQSLVTVDKLLSQLESLLTKETNTADTTGKRLMEIFNNKPETLELTMQLKDILQNLQEVKGLSPQRQKEFLTKANEMLANPQQKLAADAIAVIKQLKVELNRPERSEQQNTILHQNKSEVTETIQAQSKNKVAVTEQQTTLSNKHGTVQAVKQTEPEATVKMKGAVATQLGDKVENNATNKQQAKPLTEVGQLLKQQIQGDAKKVTTQATKLTEDATVTQVGGKAENNAVDKQAKPFSEVTQFLKQQVKGDVTAQATRQAETEDSAKVKENVATQSAGKAENNAVNKQQAKPLPEVAQILKQQVEVDAKKVTAQTVKLAETEGSAKMAQLQTKPTVETAELLKQQSNIGKKQGALQDAKADINATNKPAIDTVQKANSHNSKAGDEVKGGNNTVKTQTQEPQTFSTQAVQRETTPVKTEGTVRPEQVSGKLLGMVKEMNVKQQPNNTTMRLKLHPEQLGEVTIRLTFNRGELSAQFYASTVHGKEALEAALPQMRDALFQQQVKLSEANVFLGQGSNQWSGQQQQQNRSQGRGWRQGNYYNNSDGTVATPLTAMEGKGNTVDDGVDLLV
ncbi:MAG: hypothetical protein FH758_04770 [Firmicutes bacterium]|nr:hypothetical protein [Bacillota bacterium]